MLHEGSTSIEDNLIPDELRPPVGGRHSLTVFLRFRLRT